MKRMRLTAHVQRDGLSVESGEERRRGLHAFVLLKEDIRECVAIALFTSRFTGIDAGSVGASRVVPCAGCTVLSLLLHATVPKHET